MNVSKQAASSKQQAASSKQQAASSKQPISLLIGYGWQEHQEGDGLNEHWNFLRDQVQKAADELKKRAAGRQPASHALRLSVGRLRGRHGASLLGGILHKIESADVLIFDITGDNPNVLFELGYALAAKGADSGRVFVFCDKAKKPCSDVRGYMLTYYLTEKSGLEKTKKTSPSFKLEDARGFLAAMRGTLVQIAMQRDMWSTSEKLIEID